jgi:general secretion pathway protein K
LLVVLWTLVLIAFLVAHIAASGRTEIRVAENLVANAVAAAAADGAISAAIFNLSDPKPDRHWPVDGSTREIKIGNSVVSLRLEDEASWVNPSSASPQLVEALLRAVGRDPQRARTLAAAISEWVGTVAVARPQEALLADYRAAGLDHGPPGAPLQSLDELGRVIGMTPEILAAIRPHLTMFGPAEPNPATADPVVARALAQLGEGSAPSPANQPPPDLLTTRITATARGPGNARVTRLAVVRFGAALGRGYDVMFWGRDLR